MKQLEGTGHERLSNDCVCSVILIISSNFGYSLIILGSFQCCISFNIDFAREDIW